MRSIFPVLSMDRAKSNWEEAIHELTPVEAVGPLRVKRDDMFAPLGYGGVNGAKVRQLIWLLRRYLSELPAGSRPGVILAGSVKSPQLGRVPTVARYFGIPTMIVTGSAPATAARANENVRIALAMGAQFLRAPAPYNPVLQSESRKLHAEFPSYYLLEYGLSVEGSDERIEAFYRFCSEQVRSVPDDVETLLVPAGSCNTTISVLYGVSRFRPPGLKRIVLFGIGPPRVEWFEQRLSMLGVSGLFQRSYPHHPEMAARFGDGPAPYQLFHYDLHTTRFASYQEEMPGRIGEIDLHPTYEGKMLRYMRQRDGGQFLRDGRSLFWIVGSAPSWAAMRGAVGG